MGSKENLCHAPDFSSRASERPRPQTVSCRWQLIMAFAFALLFSLKAKTKNKRQKKFHCFFTDFFSTPHPTP